MRRLCTRISHRSQVSEPSPSGDFRTGTLRRFVGRGIGPLIATPVRSLIILIWEQTLSTFFGSVPESEIRAFCGMGSPRGSALLDVDALPGGDSLPHVPDREATELGEELERLDDQGLGGLDLHDRGVPGLDRVGLLLLHAARLLVEGLLELLE